MVRRRQPAGKLWIVSELYYPEDTSTGKFLTSLAEGLSSNADVRVICARPTYASRGVRAPRQETHADVPIYRCRSTTLDRGRIVFRLLNVLTLTVAMCVECITRIRSGDKVLVVTNPPTLPAVLALCCRLRGASLNVLVHDVYPDVLMVAGRLAPGAWIARTIDKINSIVYGQAAVIVVIGRDMKKLLVMKHGDRIRDKTTVITNWADDNLQAPVPKANNSIIQDLDLARSFVVNYAGNMGHTHDVESLVTAALTLGPEVTFVVAGGGAKRALLETMVKGGGLAQVKLLSRVPSNQSRRLSHLLSAGDVALIAFVPGMEGVSVPSRMYNVLAAGMPVIGMVSRESELGLVIAEEGLGWVVAPGDVDGLIAAIQDAKRHPDRLKDMSIRARRAAADKYRLEIALDHFRALLD